MVQTNKLLVLDLDETLIHSERYPLRYDSDFWIGSLGVAIRPSAKDFLGFCFAHFRYVAVWTAATEPYANIVLDHLNKSGKFLFIWSREQCKLQNGVYFKSVQKIRKHFHFRTSDILCVDDSPEKFEDGVENVIPAKRFFGDPTDEELTRLIVRLRTC